MYAVVKGKDLKKLKLVSVLAPFRACTERREERLETSRPSRLAFGVKPVYAERWKGQGGRETVAQGVRQYLPIPVAAWCCSRVRGSIE